MKYGFERGVGLLSGIRDLPRHMNMTNTSYAALVFLFSITGPIAIVLAAAHQGGLSDAETSSWIFGMHFVPGFLITLFVSLYYKQPLMVVVTLPGIVLVGNALTRYSMNEMVGVYLVTGILVIVLGLTGAVKRFLNFLPLPIVMGMVAGVMLKFGLDIFRPLADHFTLTLAMIIFFLVFSSFRKLASFFPPVLAVIIVGTMIAGFQGELNWGALKFEWTSPLWIKPAFSVASLLEVVVPLTITIVVIQSGQGFAVLRSSGFKPPINTMVTLAGLGSLFMGPMGSTSASPAGPVVGMFAHEQNGPKEGRYVSTVVTAFFQLIIALFATTMTSFANAVPTTIIIVVGGLALLPMILQSFQETFQSGKFKMGGLIALLVTISDISILGLSSAFWALIFGLGTSFLLERKDFASIRA